MVQWLGLRASTAGGVGLISDQGTKIPHAMQRGQKKKKLTVNITLTDKKTEFFPLKIRNKAKMSKLTTPIPHHTRSPRQYKKSGKRNEVYTNCKEQSKTVPICK